MYTPQAGIFALGTSSHAYLEFDLLDAKKCKEFASIISAIREPRTTTGGVNFVIGFRPELWRELIPEDTPAGVEGFNKEIQGTEGFVAESARCLGGGVEGPDSDESLQQKPGCVANAHRVLDEAVFAAYGWPADLGKEKILARLLALNHERATEQGEAVRS
jgi:hypothetical protein